MSKQHLTDAHKTGQGTVQTETVQKTGQYADFDPGGKVQGHPTKDGGFTLAPDPPDRCPDRWGCVTEEQRQRRLKIEGCIKSAIDKVLVEFGLSEKQPGSSLMVSVSYEHPDWLTIGCNIVASPRYAPPKLKHGWLDYAVCPPDLGEWVLVQGASKALYIGRRLYGVPYPVGQDGGPLYDPKYWHALPDALGDQCASGS